MLKRISPIDHNAHVMWTRSFPKLKRTRKTAPHIGYCVFCGREDRTGHLILSGQRLYAPMLRIDLWRRIGAKALRGVMCLACMRRRVGRPFTEWDVRKPWW